MLVIFLFGGEGNFHQIEEKFKEKKKKATTEWANFFPELPKTLNN